MIVALPTLQSFTGDIMAGTLDPAGLHVRLFVDGPDPITPASVLGDFTLAVGTNSKTITAWEQRLNRLGEPTLTSTNILEFIPGTDFDVGQTIRGFVIVDATPDLVASERFVNPIEGSTADDHVKFVINLTLDPLGDYGTSVQIS